MQNSFSISEKNKFPTTVGVYSITFKNSKSNKLYVGSTADTNKNHGFNRRWRRHISDLDRKKHFSRKLQNACDKYGIENLIFCILIECDKNNCLIEEQKFIDKYDSFNNGYNSRPVSNSQLGFRHSSETCEKIKKVSEKRKKFLIDQYKNHVLKLYRDNISIRKIQKLLPIKRKIITEILKNAGVVIKKRADYIRIPIYQYDSNGNFLKKWNSAYECAKNTHFSERDIRRSCSNKSITKDCIFCKELKCPKIIMKDIKESYRNMKIKHKESLKKSFTKERRAFMSKINLGNNNRGRIENIGQYDLEGNLLKVWKDTIEIVKFFNLKNSSPITRVLRGERSLFKRSYWKVVDSNDQSC